LLLGSKEPSMNRWINRLLGRNPRPVRSHKPRRAFHLGVEALEDRLVMTGPASAFAVSVAHPPAVVSVPVTTLSIPQVVDLTTTPNQVVTGSVSASNPHTYRMSLKAGDLVFVNMQPGFGVLDVQQEVAALQGTSLSIIGPQGAVSPIAPPAGVGSPFGLPDCGFRAGVAGTYSLSFTARAKSAFNYTLDLHRLALVQGAQNPASLEQSGPMYAFLTGTGSNRTLSLTGPTGYGFAITGNWAQTINSPSGTALTGSTYSATGALTLQTALGPVPLAVTSGETFTVTTSPNAFGAYFGEVKSIQADFGLALGTYVARYTQALTAIGLDMSKISVLNDKWKIELGSQVSQQRGGAEVLAGVPYFVYGGQAGYQASFGGVSINKTLSPSDSGTVIIAEPSDPFLYVGHVAQDGTLDWQFAGSLNGRIPYTPEYKPTSAAGAAVTQFFGHVFAAGTYDLSGLTGLPLTAAGGVTMNLDAKGIGLPSATASASQLFADLARQRNVGVQLLGGKGNAGNVVGGQLSGLAGVFSNIDVGVNAELDLGYQAAGYNFTIRLGGASAVFNGPQGALWLRGVRGVDNPLAGTPFAWLTANPSDSLEATAYSNGRFVITLDSEYPVLGTNLSFTLTLTNSGVTARVHGDVKWELDSNDYVEADFDATLWVTYASGRLHYSGSATATGTLATIFGSESGGVSAWVTDGAIGFDIFGHGESIHLP
jgi:hypothetical protein